MKNLKKTLTSLLILSSLSTAGTFEQNGVKEGNNRISGSANLTFPDGGGTGITAYAQYGRFMTDNIEVMVDLLSSKGSGKDSNTTYYFAIGANYYFAKTPTLTPFIGMQYYTSGLMEDSDYIANGSRTYIGAHKFITENFAITPEAGVRFIDFTEYSQSYLNVYLTYFFD